MITLTPQGRSLLKRVCKVIMRDVKHFDMGDWIVPHIEDGKSCGTTACIAGHVVLQAGYPAPLKFIGRLFPKMDVPRLATALLTGDTDNALELESLFYVGNWPRAFANRYYAAAAAVDAQAKAEAAVARIEHLLKTGE